MRITINIDDDVIAKVMHCSHTESRANNIRIALRAYIEQQCKQQVPALCGKLNLEDSWQALRKLEIPE